MRLLFTKCISIGIVFFIFAANANALLINPDPTTFQEDNGAELFLPATDLFAVKLASPLSGTFGFYYSDSPTALIPIFDFTKVLGTSASVDFNSGLITDNDFQNSFSFTTGLGSIGFYFTNGFTTIFTESILNQGVDLVSTFPGITDTSAYLLGFDFSGTGSLSTEVVEFVGGITAVPEPGIISILGIGILLLGFSLNKKKNQISFKCITFKKNCWVHSTH